jgi:hypothetical protein
MVWLNEPASMDRAKEQTSDSRDWTSALAGAFGLLLLVIFSATWLSS